MRRLALGTALVLLVFACGGGDVFTLPVGTCFDDQPDGQISSVPEVDCAEPHDNEVFALIDYTETEDFPGPEAMHDLARGLCIDEFAEYVGVAYEASVLEVFPITPTADSWAGGDREIICNLFNADFSKLTGTMEGAAR